MMNNNNTTLYLGVTSDLLTRIHDHKEKVNPSSFTARYNISKLVYFEVFSSIEEAIAREKQLKSGSRKRKLDLIEAVNPKYTDLYQRILEENYEITSSLRSLQ